MDPSAPVSAGLLRDLSDARERVLSVLKRLSADPAGAGEIAEAMVALQDAANRLGSAEDELGRLDRRAADAPAPVVGPEEAPEDEGPAWTGEAAAVMALAEFGVAYASGPAEEAEHWLRALRREGSVGRALGDLGFPESQLRAQAEPVRSARSLEAVEAVAAKAKLLARHRGASEVTTSDILFAVLAMYGGLADRSLYSRGIAREDLLSLLAEGAPGHATLRR